MHNWSLVVSILLLSGAVLYHGLRRDYFLCFVSVGVMGIEVIAHLIHPESGFLFLPLAGVFSYQAITRYYERRKKRTRLVLDALMALGPQTTVRAIYAYLDEERNVDFPYQEVFEVLARLEAHGMASLGDNLPPFSLETTARLTDKGKRHLTSSA